VRGVEEETCSPMMGSPFACATALAASEEILPRLGGSLQVSPGHEGRSVDSEVVEAQAHPQITLAGGPRLPLNDLGALRQVKVADMSTELAEKAFILAASYHRRHY